jgi:hypothetical protein
MLDAQQTLDRYYHEMRWRILSLAADIDRVQRAPGADQLSLTDEVGRAERVQMMLSDKTPPPAR